MSEVRTRRGRLALAATLAAVAVAAADPAGAACTTEREARDLQASLRDVVRCRHQTLKGRTRACKQRPAPPCADPLFGDALALVFGANDSPLGAVDDRALRKQLWCQKKIGGAAAKYVGKRLRGLVRGKDEAVAEKGARRKLDRLTRHCNVSVAEDVGGVVLPAVGPQCAAALGTPGAAIAPAPLGDCLATLLGVWVERAGPDPQPLRPNIVLVLTDDQRFDTTDATHSVDGAPVMPGIRAELAERGVEFPDAFLTTPLCCPSRSSLLAGSYAHRTGVYRNSGTNGGADDFEDDESLATWLQGAGYRTSLMGKYLNGYRGLWDPDLLEPPYVPPGWSDWHGMATVKYYDYEIVEPDGAGGFALVPYGETEADYSTDVLREKAKAFIAAAVEAGEPFFLYLAFKAPHSPFTPAPRHEGEFQALPPWRPPNYNEEDVSDKPTWMQNTPLLTPEEQADLDQVRIDQLEMLQAVDEAIGGSALHGIVGLMEHLRALGVEKDTIVVFLSDNGWHWGEHRTRAKNKPYEEAIRAPMLVHYPRLAPLPRVDLRFALNIDLAPTFAELAGVPIPVPHDGESLVRVLDGTQPEGTWRTDFLTEGWPSSHVWATVREAQWKYTELPMTLGDAATTFERELYDLAADPYELENRAGDLAQAERIERMALRLRELRPAWPLDSDPGGEDPPEPDDD
jgi:N-acetylglucosamine-6-sulfatase